MQSTDAEHRKNGPHNGQSCAGAGNEHTKPNWFFQAMTVCELACRNGHEHLRNRKKSQQNAHRHGAVALLQSQEWRGQTHACHASVQKNLSAD